MFNKTYRIVALLVFNITLFISQSYATTVTIKPGSFSHFNISASEKIVAGQTSTITLTAVDSLNNIINNFNESNKEFQALVTGSAIITPSTFKSASFKNGAFEINITGKVAELVTISIREVSKLLPLVTKDIIILPSGIKLFSIAAAKSFIVAGEPLSITLTAKDSFGNTTKDVLQEKNIAITFKGDADPKMVGELQADPNGGIAKLKVVSEKTGTFNVEVKDLISGASGSSQSIEVIGGAANSFRLLAPKEVVAGEPFDLSIIALDKYGNVANTYGLSGQGVRITSSGKGKPFPSTVAAYEFVLGQAIVPLVYNAVEDIQLTVSEHNGQYKSMSDIIKITAPVVSKYEVITPETAVAGQKFKIKITALNRDGKPIKNYNIFGHDVEISSKNGTGALEPSRIPASNFVDGHAIVEVKYNKSESFEIIATEIASEPTPIISKPKPVVKKQRRLTHTTTIKDKDLITSKSKRTTMEIQNISMVETKNKTNVTLHLSEFVNTMKYTAYNEVHDGKRFIVLKLSPVISTLSEPVSLESGYIKNVQIEETPNDSNTKLVKLEINKPTRFNIAKGKNSLHIILKR